MTARICLKLPCVLVLFQLLRCNFGREGGMRCEAMRGIEGARGQWIANQDSDHLLCSVSRSLPPGRPMRCAGHTPHMRHSKKLMLRDPQSSHRGTDRELEGGRQQVLGCLRMRGGSCYWRESEFFGSLDPDIDPRGDIWRTSAWRRKIRQRQEERESHRTVISTPFGTTEYVFSPAYIKHVQENQHLVPEKVRERFRQAEEMLDEEETGERRDEEEEEEEDESSISMTEVMAEWDTRQCAARMAENQRRKEEKQRLIEAARTDELARIELPDFVNDAELTESLKGDGDGVEGEIRAPGSQAPPVFVFQCPPKLVRTWASEVERKKQV